MTKYQSRKTTVDNITFDSKKEANRYMKLKLLQKAGQISNLKLQPEFELQPGFRKNGKSYRPIHYIADFKYIDAAGNTIIEDTKGYKTKTYSIKKKLFEYKFKNLTILES
jgi:hypothetical protein